MRSLCDPVKRAFCGVESLQAAGLRHGKWCGPIGRNLWLTTIILQKWSICRVSGDLLVDMTQFSPPPSPSTQGPVEGLLYMEIRAWHLLLLLVIHLFLSSSSPQSFVSFATPHQPQGRSTFRTSSLRGRLSGVSRHSRLFGEERAAEPRTTGGWKEPPERPVNYHGTERNGSTGRETRLADSSPFGLVDVV